MIFNSTHTKWNGQTHKHRVLREMGTFWVKVAADMRNDLHNYTLHCRYKPLSPSFITAYQARGANKTYQQKDSTQKGSESRRRWCVLLGHTARKDRAKLMQRSKVLKHIVLDKILFVCLHVSNPSAVTILTYITFDNIIVHHRLCFVWVLSTNKAFYNSWSCVVLQIISFKYVYFTNSSQLLIFTIFPFDFTNNKNHHFYLWRHLQE
jgi:hypothetical protein